MAPNETESGSEVLPQGTLVAGLYQVESVLGEGASGVVYVARAMPGGDRVALKVIHRSLCNDAHFSGRFTREATILKQLEGNHIVRLLDIAEHDGLPVLVLEYIEGSSLEAVLQKASPSIEQAVEITLQICAALGAAHAGGFVHRDLKPGNVLVQGELGQTRTPMVWVVDFGLGKALHREPTSISLTERDMIVGTPAYMSPEQVHGDEVDRRCDIYAAGVMLFEMLTGSLPFTGRTPIAVMTAHLTEPIPKLTERAPQRGISSALEAVVTRALAKNPDERYPTARAFAEALVTARDEKSSHHVIAPQEVADAANLAFMDTDLELNAEVAKVRPEIEKAIVAQKEQKARNEQKTETTKADTKKPHLGWMIAAAVLALVAILVGTMMGGR